MKSIRTTSRSPLQTPPLRYSEEADRSRKRIRRGAVLIAALVITAVLAGMILVLNRSMRVEQQAAGNEAASTQADGIERAAEQYVLGLLTTDMSTVQNLSEDQFQVHVGDQGTGGTFLIVRPNYDDQSLPLYGLVEEGSKLDLDKIATQPGGAILARFVQDDDTTSAIEQWASPSGVDSYYNSLPNPYQCKGAPFESVEELLMVRGITRQILYGDGSAPPLGERQNVLANTGGNAILSDSQLSRGIFDLLTISAWNAEPKTLPDGTARSRIDQMSGLRTVLTNLTDQSRGQQIIRRVGRNLPTSLFDLALRGQMTSEEIDQIADFASAPQNAVARIEVNQAPPSVLYALVGSGGILQTDIDSLLAARQQNIPQVGTIGWVMNTIGPGAASRLGRYITNRSYFFSADIHAYTDDGRAFKRVRIVVDARTTTPEIVYRRDITDRPDPMDRQNMDSLRHGQGLAIGTTSAFSTSKGIQ